MRNEQIEINIENGVKELVIREGKAIETIPLPSPLVIKGAIDLPFIHLKNLPKGILSEDKFGESQLSRSYAEINREKLSIVFFEDGGKYPWQSTYTGKLELDENLLKFGINTGDSYTTSELSEFIKMNRSWFETKDKAMSLVSQLRNFRVKVEQDIEDKDDRRGNRSFLIAQAVDHNIPDSFRLNIPIFKNFPNKTIDVEINIDASDFSCTLISPELNDYVVDIKNEYLDVQKNNIKELFPELRVFEV